LRQLFAILVCVAQVWASSACCCGGPPLFDLLFGVAGERGACGQMPDRAAPTANRTGVVKAQAVEKRHGCCSAESAPKSDRQAPRESAAETATVTARASKKTRVIENDAPELAPGCACGDHAAPTPPALATAGQAGFSFEIPHHDLAPWATVFSASGPCAARNDLMAHVLAPTANESPPWVFERSPSPKRLQRFLI
jgi:hypothetical protein